MNATLLAPFPATPARAHPAPVFTVRLPDGWTGDVFDRIDAIDPELWRSCFPPHWKDYRYYRTLEETFPDQFPQRYLLLRHEGAARAILPLFFVEQDLTVSLHERLRAWLKPLRPWLTYQVLMAGCVVGDMRIGLAERSDLPLVLPLLDEAVTHYARHEGVSILLCKDFPPEYRPDMAKLVADGRYLRLASLPCVSLKLDFTTFDEYVQTRLGKATRKSLRRKFREVEALPEPITLEVKSSVSDTEAGELHALYERVALRGDVQFEVFTKEYFRKLGERMPDQARFFTWRYAGQIVAFSFCVVHDGTIYDNDIGLDEEVASALNLYHVTFRDIVRWALAHGLRRYESSPFNYDPKLHLRMTLVPYDLYARHTSPVMHRILRWFAPLLAPTRREPLLRQFPNADEM